MLAAETRYEISSVTVIMDGVDVTSSAWNSSTSTISIASVTGDIIISALAESSIEPVVEIPLSVSIDLSGDTLYDYNAPDDLRKYLKVIYTEDGSSTTLTSADYSIAGPVFNGASAPLSVSYNGET